MRYTRTLLMTAIAAALFAGCDDNDPMGPERRAEEFDWSGTVAKGERIEIKNSSSDVRASFTSGSEVVVHATRSGRKSDPASVTIEVVQHAEGGTLCAVYPDDPRAGAKRMPPGLQGNMSTRDNDVNVEFTLSIPAGVEFAGRVVSGDVEADGLRSDAFASTVERQHHFDDRGNRRGHRGVRKLTESALPQ